MLIWHSSRLRLCWKTNLGSSPKISPHARQTPYGSTLSPTWHNPSPFASYNTPMRSWNPVMRTLIDRNEPTLIFKARSQRARTAWRLFIGLSCFMLAGNCLHTFTQPPDGFSPLLRRFMALSSIVLGGCGIFAVSRNVLAVKSIIAVPVHGPRSNTQLLLLRIETTRWPPWRQRVIVVQPREVSLTEPIKIDPTPQVGGEGQSLTKIVLLLPIRITLSQLIHLWCACREIVFAEGRFLRIAGRGEAFRIDEEPVFIDRKINQIIASTNA